MRYRSIRFHSHTEADLRHTLVTANQAGAAGLGGWYIDGNRERSMSEVYLIVEYQWGDNAPCTLAVFSTKDLAEAEQRRLRDLGRTTHIESMEVNKKVGEQ